MASPDDQDNGQSYASMQPRADVEGYAAADAPTATAGAQGAAEAEEVSTEAQDIKDLRRELRRLRRGKEVMSIRVRKARRELARTRKRQKDAEKVLIEAETAVAVISQRLGCASEGGLPEIDEWRVIMTEHKHREKELSHQIESEKEAHEKRVKELEEELKKGGRPETAKSREAEKLRAKRMSYDDCACRLQTIYDRLAGNMEGFSWQEIQELLRPADSVEEVAEAEQVAVGLQQYEDLMQAILDDVKLRFDVNARNLTKLSNTELGKKDRLLKVLAYNALGRGLEDIKLCTPTEMVALRELLKDVTAITLVKRRQLQQ